MARFFPRIYLYTLFRLLLIGAVFAIPFVSSAAECKNDTTYERTCADSNCANAGKNYTINKSLTCSDKKTCCEKKKDVAVTDQATCENAPVNGKCKSGCDSTGETQVGTCRVGTASNPCCKKNGGTTSDSSVSCTGSGEKCQEASCDASTTTQVGKCRVGTSEYNCCKETSSISGSQTTTATTGTFTPLENIPFSEGVTDFAEYVQAIFNFGIWSVGIAALLMITVGGFFYLTAAGNTSQVGTAKSIIGDALLGLVMAFFSWLVLYVINPDLVNVNLSSLSDLYTDGTGATSGSGGTGNTTGSAIQKTTCGGKAECNSTEFNNAVNNAASKYGIDANIIKAIAVGGEGCNKSLSSDGFGSCGYSQALPSIRTKCGISGSNSETCKKVQNDVQLDINCLAWLLSSNKGRCGLDVRNVASCYNSGKPNNCSKTTKDYCGRVESFYSSCKK